MPFDRRPLRDLIVTDILERLEAGQLPVGTRVDERVLANELQVSRTPVREALSLLAYEGILETRVGKGFWVAPLAAKDIAETHPIILALESYAVTQIRPDVMKQLAAELRAAADAMEQVADSPAEAQQADNDWHRRLVGQAENQRLNLLLTRIKQSVGRAEYRLMRNSNVVLRSVAQHRAVADALGEGELPAALELLDHNWRDGMREMLKNFVEPPSEEPMK